MTYSHMQILKEIKNTVLGNAYCHLCLGTDVLTYMQNKNEKKYCIRQCILLFEFGYGCTYMLEVSVMDRVSSVRASLDRLWISLSCSEVGAYDTW